MLGIDQTSVIKEQIYVLKSRVVIKKLIFIFLLKCVFHLNLGLSAHFIIIVLSFNNWTDTFVTQTS